MGGAVLAALRAGGHEVRALVRGAEGARNVAGANVSVVVGELSDAPALRWP